MSSEKPLCFCFEVSDSDIRKHFLEDRGTYESLVEKTKIGTKCTACLLDLDVVLESIHKGRSQTIFGEEEGTEPWGIRVPQDFTESGFFICENSTKTYIRLVNQGQLFSDESPVVPMSYSLMVFSESGKLSGRKNGRLLMKDEAEISFHDLPSCPDRGWFLLSLRAETEGLFGTMRPQVAICGENWHATYHTQPHVMATVGKYRYSVTLLGGDNGLSASVSVVNAGNTKSAIDIHVSAANGSYHETAKAELPPLGSRILDLEVLFPGAPCDSPVFVDVFSDYPTRKHIICRHQDGSMSIDHFPN